MDVYLINVLRSFVYCITGLVFQPQLQRHGHRRVVRCELELARALACIFVNFGDTSVGGDFHPVLLLGYDWCGIRSV